MLQIVISAVRPWDSPDSGGFLVGLSGGWVRSDFSTYDDQTQIELCLSCPFADDCHDCVTDREKTGRKRGLFARRKSGKVRKV